MMVAESARDDEALPRVTVSPAKRSNDIETICTLAGCDTKVRSSHKKRS